MVISPIRTRVLKGFDDPAFGPQQWEELLGAGATNVVFLTWLAQRTWWETFRIGELLLIVAERNGRAVALAPLWAASGMVCFLGSGMSDYLDFLGDVGDPEVLDALLETARDCVPEFVGFRFHHVLETSRTGQRLEAAAARLGFACYRERTLPAPALDLGARPALALAAANKKHLLKCERYFRRDGSFRVCHLRDGEAILPHLGEFFEQEVARCATTSRPSRFSDRVERAFFERFTRAVSRTGWLRFTRIDWQGLPLAFHFGFCYRGTYLFYQSSFAADRPQRSPGLVLLRHVLLAAIGEGARTFDFGIGGEPYKYRFATHTNQVHTWGLYPATSRTAYAKQGEQLVQEPCS